MNTFSSGVIISSSAVNANFTNCVAVDTARVVTVTHTWSLTQTFTGGWTAAAACTISAGGIAVTGNSTITGTLTALTGVTSSGTAAFATVTVSGTVTMSTAVSQIIPGATSLAFRNNAGSADNILITDAGYVTVRSNLQVNGGSIFYGGTTSKIVPGATSISLRNNADGADNLLITDAGAFTFRGGTTISASGALFSGAITTSPSASLTQAPLNIPHGSAPTSPTNGDFWTTTAGLFVRINGVTKTVTLT